MRLISRNGVSDEPGQDPGCAVYRSMEIGDGEYCWFEMSPVMANGGWGTPRKQKPEPK